VCGDRCDLAVEGLGIGNSEPTEIAELTS